MGKQTIFLPVATPWILDDRNDLEMTNDDLNDHNGLQVLVPL